MERRAAVSWALSDDPADHVVRPQSESADPRDAKQASKRQPQNRVHSKKPYQVSVGTIVLDFADRSHACPLVICLRGAKEVHAPRRVAEALPDAGRPPSQPSGSRIGSSNDLPQPFFTTPQRSRSQAASTTRGTIGINTMAQTKMASAHFR